MYFLLVKDSNHLLVLCKVEYRDSGYKTLGPLRRVNFTDKELFIEYLSLRLGILTEGYTSNPISKLSFTYIVKSGLAGDRDRGLLQDLKTKPFTVHRFNNMNLPITVNPEEYGEVISNSYIQIKGEMFNRFVVESGTRLYIIDATSDGLTNKVRIQGAIDLSWIDTKISDDLFKREIGKSVMFFMDGVRVLSKKLVNAKPFAKLSTDKTLVNNFVTMDIETVTIDSKITPYLICAYNGTSYITSYANESLDQASLFKGFVFDLLSFFEKDLNTLTVYAHNLSNFDGIFLVKHLLAFGKVEPLLHNGKLISIKLRLNIGGKGKTIIFKDSYLLLKYSLRNLCEAFNVEIPKGYFPFNLTNIFYAGLMPPFDCWVGISADAYESLLKEFKGKTWNFEVEAIKYCKLDCKCLHEVLSTFNTLIFKHFNVNIHVPLTLPALAMRIYKSQYMPKDTIYQLLGSIEQDIRNSYTGGAVDVYIPHNRITSLLEKGRALFNKLFYYDVNSLYPFVMANTPIPVGKPFAFEGDIRNIEPDAFGFFYCKITSPSYLEHPILQRRVKTVEGIRTVAGLGTWTGWIFSGEMDNAIKFGYTFDILRGYQFEKGYIYKDYVNKMYNLRLQYEKGHPMNLIAKLLLNSLYGKFGMKSESTIVEIFNTSNESELDLFKEMLEVFGTGIQDFIKIDNHYITIRNNITGYKYNADEELYHGVDVNVAIASAITAGARMWMSILKNNSKFNLFYSDTDSVVVNKPLPKILVGSALGQFKLENVLSKAVFLAPKVYGLITEDGKEIIKVKGLKDEALVDIHFKDLEQLLVLDSKLEFTQEKWFKKIMEGDITVAEVAYTLKVTSNKRVPIYVDNVFSNTKPFNYDEIETKE